MPAILARPLRAALVILLTLSILPPWLMTLRGAIDGASYEWGFTLFQMQIAGAGTGGDYPLLLAYFALGAVALLAGWRGSRRTAGLLAVAWFGLLAASGLHGWLSGERFVVQGDTLGVNVDLTWAFVGLPVLAALLGAGLVAAPGGQPDGWTRLNFSFAALLAAILTFAAASLVAGEPHGVSDGWGVIALLSGLGASGPALAGWPGRRRNAAAAA